MPIIEYLSSKKSTYIFFYKLIRRQITPDGQSSKILYVLITLSLNNLYKKENLCLLSYLPKLLVRNISKKSNSSKFHSRGIIKSVSKSYFFTKIHSIASTISPIIDCFFAKIKTRFHSSGLILNVNLCCDKSTLSRRRQISSDLFIYFHKTFNCFRQSFFCYHRHSINTYSFLYLCIRSYIILC